MKTDKDYDQDPRNYAGVMALADQSRNLADPFKKGSPHYVVNAAWATADDSFRKGHPHQGTTLEQDAWATVFFQALETLVNDPKLPKASRQFFTDRGLWEDR